MVSGKSILIQLHLSTGADSKSVRFGMSEFKFDTDKKVALLNGKPYYIRGTNLALHRFMDDTVRHDLPWNKDWVIQMHKKFKELHWNTYRFHVGFAPDFWYDIADEMGFLIADEYAWVWLTRDGNPTPLTELEIEMPK